MCKYPLISIIVPIYNTERYLEDCIKSVLSQTFTDWELVLVDDGSTDKSLDICYEMARDDNRIRVVHQKNSGVSKARKTGLEHSNGSFICFVDSDDALQPVALEAYSRIISCSPDIDIILSATNSDGIVTNEQYLNDCLLSRFLPLWTRLFRKKILVESKALDIPREINIGEDIIGNIRAALYANKIATVAKNVYIYRENLASATHTGRFTSKHAEMISAEVEKLLQENRKDVLSSEVWYKFRLHLLTSVVVLCPSFNYKDEWIHTLLNEKHSYRLSTNEWIVKNITYAKLGRIALIFMHRLWLHKQKIYQMVGIRI